MTAEVMYEGPKPPEGERWCFVCAFTFKAAVNERFAATIEQAQKEPDGSPVMTIDATETEGLPPLYPAVATGLFVALQQFGPLDLCWSHLNAIRLQTASGLALPPPGMGVPGMNGMGGGFQR